MTNFKIRGKCNVCKKTKWLVRQRVVKLPTGMEATSQDLYCGKCNRAMQAAINTMTIGHE